MVIHGEQNLVLGQEELIHSLNFAAQCLLRTLAQPRPEIHLGGELVKMNELLLPNLELWPEVIVTVLVGRSASP